MSWSINQNKCVWSQVVESTSTATSRWSRCMTWVLREASVANIARLRAVTEQTHTCINTPPSALHLVWVFHIGAVLTCMWVFCDQHSKGDKEHRFISGQVNLHQPSKRAPHPTALSASRHRGDVQRCFGNQREQLSGQMQTEAVSELWQFWQARLSLVCPSSNVDPPLYQWTELLEFHQGLSALCRLCRLSGKRRESSVISVRTHFYLPPARTITWVNNTTGWASGPVSGHILSGKLATSALHQHHLKKWENSETSLPLLP